MKVLYLCRALNMGGLEKNLLLLTPRLRKLGVEVHVGSGGGEIEHSFVQAGATLHRLSFDVRDPRAVARDTARLRRLLRDERFDVVHVFSAAPGLCMALAQRRLPSGSRPHHVASVMGLQESADERAWVTHLRNYLTVVGADRRLVISPMIGRYLRRLPIRRSTLEEVPVVGVEVPELPDAAGRAATRREVRAELGLPAEDALVTTIGYLGPRKSHELFIRAADVVLRRQPETSFLIVGTGPARPALQREIDARGLAERVHLTGLRRDVNRLLTASDVCVKPGVLEGFIGITVLEAQALEVPVVAFDTVDVHLAIEDDVTGVIAPLGDSRALGEAIASLLANPGRAARIARRGRERAVRVFGLESVAAGLVDAYRRGIRR